MKSKFLYGILLIPFLTFSQIGINTETPDSSSALEVASNTQGFLPPRMSYDQMKAINNPAQGLMIYCTDCTDELGYLVVFNGEIWHAIYEGCPSPGYCDEVTKYDPNCCPNDGGTATYDPSGTTFSPTITNETELEAALAQAYDLLTSYSWSVLAAEIISDNALKGGASQSDMIGLEFLDHQEIFSNNIELNQIWNFFFAGYTRASYVMIKGQQLDSQTPNTLDLITEAIFLRAFYSMNLIKWFGNHPYIEGFDDNNNPHLQFRGENDMIFDCYGMLEHVIANTDINFQGSYRTTFNNYTAKALLLKLIYDHLEVLDYSMAMNLFEEIKNSGVYSLDTNLDTLFSDETPAVFEIDYTSDIPAWWECLLCTQGNLLSKWQGIRNYMGPEYDTGHGLNIPSQEAFDSFENGDNRRAIAILNITEWQQTHPSTTYGQSYEQTGYYMKKYLPKLGGNNGSNGGDPSLLHGNDIKMLRYAEILLIGAELYALDNRYFDALLNLNEVRARAGLPGISSNNQQEILDAIFNERRSEFMGEGHRYFDLIHFNKAAQYINGFMNHHEIFPIPASFHETFGDMPQNNGY